ncbi:hypothetical protein OQA88_9149 [Cercophora sp. LCS_1]
MTRREPVHLLLLLIELILVAAALGIAAHGHTSELRTALWTTGGERGWNSDPRARIYFYANHREPPEIPFLWTERLANSLLGVAIVNVVVWVVRVALPHGDVSMRLLGAFYDVLLAGLWTFAVNAQSASDLTDARHLSPLPWYLDKSCAELAGYDRSVCRRGRASFAMAVVCMGFYLARSVLSVLRLAYWCGEYRLIDRCAGWLSEQGHDLCSLGKTGRGGRSQRADDVQLLEAVRRRHQDSDVYWDSESDTI